LNLRKKQYARLFKRAFAKENEMLMNKAFCHIVNDLFPIVVVKSGEKLNEAKTV
jgi:hypothetical protein